jgi:hypothetical protein
MQIWNEKIWIKMGRDGSHSQGQWILKVKCHYFDLTHDWVMRGIFYYIQQFPLASIRDLFQMY